MRAGAPRFEDRMPDEGGFTRQLAALIEAFEGRWPVTTRLVSTSARLVAHFTRGNHATVEAFSAPVPSARPGRDATPGWFADNCMDVTDPDQPETSVGLAPKPAAGALRAATPVRVILAELRWENALGADLPSQSDPDRWWIVVDAAGSYRGSVTYRQLLLAQLDDVLASGTVGQLATDDGVVAYPDELPATLRARMIRSDREWLPVVASDGDRRLLGFLALNDVIPVEWPRDAPPSLQDRMLGLKDLGLD